MRETLKRYVRNTRVIRSEQAIQSENWKQNYFNKLFDIYSALATEPISTRPNFYAVYSSLRESEHVVLEGQENIIVDFKQGSTFDELNKQTSNLNSSKKEFFAFLLEYVLDLLYERGQFKKALGIACLLMEVRLLNKRSMYHGYLDFLVDQKVKPFDQTAPILKTMSLMATESRITEMLNINPDILEMFFKDQVLKTETIFPNSTSYVNIQDLLIIGHEIGHFILERDSEALDLHSDMVRYGFKRYFKDPNPSEPISTQLLQNIYRGKGFIDIIGRDIWKPDFWVEAQFEIMADILGGSLAYKYLYLDHQGFAESNSFEISGEQFFLASSLLFLNQKSLAFFQTCISKLVDDPDATPSEDEVLLAISEYAIRWHVITDLYNQMYIEQNPEKNLYPTWKYDSCNKNSENLDREFIEFWMPKLRSLFKDSFIELVGFSTKDAKKVIDSFFRRTKENEVANLDDLLNAIAIENHASESGLDFKYDSKWVSDNLRSVTAPLGNADWSDQFEVQGAEISENFYDKTGQLKRRLAKEYLEDL